MLCEGIVLLHDNAGVNSVGVTQNLIEEFSWKQFKHPPYSPDLAPPEYHLFLNLKSDFGRSRRRFEREDDTKSGVQQWLLSQAASFYEEGM